MSAHRDSIDIESLQALRAALEEEFADLIETFLDDSPKKLARLELAFSRRDRGQLRDAVHSLKGSSSNLSALRLAHLCEALEDELDGLDFSQIEQRIEQIRQEYQQAAMILGGFLD